MGQQLPNGNLSEVVVGSAEELGAFIRKVRKSQGLTQVDIAGLGNTGNRVIVDIENGKPTVQLQKVLNYVSLLGLELVVKKKGRN